MGETVVLYEIFADGRSRVQRVDQDELRARRQEHRDRFAVVYGAQVGRSILRDVHEESVQRWWPGTWARIDDVEVGDG